MGRLPRNSLTAFAAWWILRRRLRRSDTPLAPVGLVGLELVGPRVFLIRRHHVLLALAFTAVGLVALALVWWALRRRGAGGDDGGGWEEPEPLPEPEPSEEIEMEEPATPVSA
jgi:hypothetical protein